MEDIQHFVEYIRAAMIDQGDAGQTWGDTKWTEQAVKAAILWSAAPDEIAEKVPPDVTPMEIVQMAFGAAWGEGLLVGLCFARDFGLPDFVKNIPAYEPA